MKKLHAEAGGRPRANDDLMALQEMTLFSAAAPYQLLPSCVVSGCAVTPGAGGTYNVAAGVVWLNAGAASGLYDFAGASNTSLPATFSLGPATPIDQRPYQTGGTKTCISDTKAVLDPVDDGPGAALYADGPIYWHEYLAARTRPLGTLEMGTYNPADFGSDGRGTGLHRGWAIPDGRNNTLDLRGRMPLFYNPDAAGLPQRPVGDMGGAETHQLTVAEMPSHQHGMNVYDNNSTGAFAKLANNNGGRGALTEFAGGNQPHNNMPPFVVVLARQWVGF